MTNEEKLIDTLDMVLLWERTCYFGPEREQDMRKAERILDSFRKPKNQRIGMVVTPLKTLEEKINQAVDELPSRSMIEILISNSGARVFLTNQNGTTGVKGGTLSERIDTALEQAKQITGK